MPDYLFDIPTGLLSFRYGNMLMEDILCVFAKKKVAVCSAEMGGNILIDTSFLYLITET